MGASQTTSTMRDMLAGSHSSKNLQLSAMISVATFIVPTPFTRRKIVFPKTQQCTVPGKRPRFTRRVAMTPCANTRRQAPASWNETYKEKGYRATTDLIVRGWGTYFELDHNYKSVKFNDYVTVDSSCTRKSGSKEELVNS